MEIKKIIEKIIKEKEKFGGIKNIVWIAAGGSYGGFYPAQYFMDRESKTIHSQVFTSNEFVYAPPKFCGPDTIAVICSMRGTPETCDGAQIAKDLGAVTISLYVDESRLTEICDYNIKYQSIALDESRQDMVNSSMGLKIAMNLLYLTEDFGGYADAMAGFEVLHDIYQDAVEYTKPLAQKWAEKNRNSKTIYVMGSGPAMGSAYIFSICNLMEMLQLDSPTVNCCEFFHGPFEILDKGTSVFLLVSEGRVRPADERAIKFLKQYGGDNVYILDAKELGINRIKDSVSEYFNHVLFSPILNNVYMRELSYVIKQDYMTRRYMWKVAY
ncbi:SIS domain-containing protein [Anaerocolumna sp. MB42-C2]|uniref:SIS domain-containing protein n=1 Tax=Anaerocolumna sp. MB42-C2 TaxID=3070997 RepID=UPI0027DF6240|nr:SIS domain-containing protein [Anaerocolumna sp. MB42-C2]WMJ86068.1 SIS domain-containing protein [Anaerocolumna sp. MB42-C2]